MSIRENLDISAYLVIGPENVDGFSVKEVIKDAIDVGFTCIQIRSKTASALELIELCREAADVISEANMGDNVALLVDDRLDVVLAARDIGIKVDGIHVGQTDIPVDICRKYLGEDSIIGLSARTDELFDFMKNVDISEIDYFGAGPLHETATKPDCGLDENGNVVERSFEELAELAKVAKLPIVIGGGVKLVDIEPLAKTGVDGFFVVSAVTLAKNPKLAAKELVDAWKSFR